MNKNFAEVMAEKINNLVDLAVEIHIVAGDKDIFSGRFYANQVYCGGDYLEISGEDILECRLPYDEEDVTYDEDNDIYEIHTKYGLTYWVFI